MGEITFLLKMVKWRKGDLLMPQIKVKKWLLAYVLIYVVVSHVAIPLFDSFKKNNFLFFYDWNIFSSGPEKEVIDLTWDNGKTFFLLDHLPRADRSIRVDFFTFYYYLDTKNMDVLRKDYIPKIKELCQCQKIEYIRFKSSYWQHYNRKEGREIVEKITL